MNELTVGLYIVVGKIPPWEPWHPGGGHESGIGYAWTRDEALAMAARAIADGWTDVVIYEPPQAQ